METVIVSNQIELNPDNFLPQLIERVKKDLTLVNPAYIQAVKYGYPIHGKPKEICLYRFEKGYSEYKMILPRGYCSSLLKLFTQYNLNPSIDDQRLILPSVDFKSTIKLRDYQEPAVEKLVKYRQGGAVAGCGAGKTIIMLETMARIGQPSLWVCHSYELLNQTIERACQVFDGMAPEEIGIIAGGKVSIGKRLTMALVQTLSRLNLDAIKDKFGAIFIDEAHHLAAKTFFHPIGQFPAKYRLWASATPEREDGLTQMVFAGGGPILYKVDSCELPTVTPRLEVIESEFTQWHEEYSKLISLLTQDRQRNNLIVDTITREAPGHFSLVLSDRVEHLETLRSMLKTVAPQLRAEILVGTLSKKVRTEIMNRMQNKEIDVLFATQLAREGLDIIHLDRLFLTTPKRASGAIQQEAGRIMRPCPGKGEPVIFDFWDNKNPILKAQFWPRRGVYTKLGIKWKQNNVRQAK